MEDKFKVKHVFKASPGKVYNAWLDSDKHSEMIGAKSIMNTDVGASFSVWDDYISGRNLELVSEQKIVQSWRTLDFKENDKDSIVEIELRSIENGCELTLTHSSIPENQPNYQEGWVENYFKPMEDFFDK